MIPFKEKKEGFDYDVNFDIDIGFNTDDVASHDFREKMLARAYVPFQKAGRMFHPEEALIKGTVYPELYRPYKHGCHSGHNI